MEREDFERIVNEVGTCEDEVKRRELLSQLRDDVTKDYDHAKELEKEMERFKSDNEKLREANMKLFLRVGEQKSPEQVAEEQTGLKDDEKTKRRFEDLFNEKGEIK